MSNQPAIILITCDELNKDVLSCFGGMQYQLLMREAIIRRFLENVTLHRFLIRKPGRIKRSLMMNL